jgi:hypothetical protein
VAIPSVSAAASHETIMVVTHTVYGCRLDEPKINKLADAVADGITPSRIALATTWSGIRVRSASLQGLRRAIDRSLQPGDPQRLQTLRIRATSRDRHARVEIGEQAATVTVEAVEAAWAIGKAEQLRTILMDAHGSARRHRWRAHHHTLAAASAAAVAVGAAIRLGLATADTTTAVLLILLVGLAGTAGLLFGRWRAACNRTLIWVDGSLPRQGWTDWSITDKIAGLALLVGLVGLVVTILATTGP